MNKEDFNRVCRTIDQFQADAINLQRELTARPALSPEHGGSGELEKAEFLYSYLQNDLCCKNLTRYDAPDNRVASLVRPNLAAIFKGKNNSKTIWLMSHMDVVPADDIDKWNSSPWEIRVEGDKIFGRGTEDNQQGIVSSLLTVKALRDQNIEPSYDLGLLLIADEETGNEYGIGYLLNNHAKLFRPGDYVIIPDSGNQSGTIVEVAEKSILWIKFTVRGKQTHGSTPALGLNSYLAASRVILDLHASLHAKFNVSDPVFEPPASTFEPTKREANVPNINTIPGEDIFYFDCRVLPRYTLKEVLAEVKRICTNLSHTLTVEILVEVTQNMQAPPPTAIEAPVVQTTKEAVAAVRGVEPTAMGIGGGTVAAYLRQAGLDAVVWATQDETLHEPNEYARISNILDDAKVFAYIALQD